MRYVDLIAERPLVWSLFLGYLVGTAFLAWLGHRRTGDMKAFAIGGGNMNPLIVGITLAASISSAATFIINPGFVYVHGLAALLHFGGSVVLGLVVGLVSMSFGVRRLGAANQALTLPQWIGARYGSRSLAMLFAVINLLSLSFVVLIIGGISIVVQATLGLGNTESLVLIVTFVFGYVLVGGTFAHAYTNTFQGIVMVVVTLMIVASGAHLITGGIEQFAASLAAIDPNLVEPVNPASSLYGSFFSVYVSGFVIGLALVCQPHIMSKALYVRDDRAVRQYLVVAIVVSLIFATLLIVGLFARLAPIPAEALLDPSSGAFRQDQVMMAYLTTTFSPEALAVIAVALLAAGMSTLDGILVALSSIAATDLYLNLSSKHRSDDDRDKSVAAHRASQIILVVMGVVAFAIALHPPKLLGIFGQVGVYGIVSASLVPILFGILFPKFPAKAAAATAVVGLGVHFVLYAAGVAANPGVTATLGIFCSVAVGLPVVARDLVRERRSERGEASRDPGRGDET